MSGAGCVVEGLSPELAGSSIKTCYQPIVRMRDRVPLAVEALARLDHPSRGVLTPDHFLREMEDSGGGCELTSAIAVQALADLSEVRSGDAAQGMLGVSINMPLGVLLHPDSIERLDRLRLRSGWAAGRILIELTESRPVEDLRELRDALERARVAGFRVALDDYTPSMTHARELLDLPFSTVKFDHLLVASSAMGGPDAAFLAATIAAVHARGWTVVAEGVTDGATWDRMAAMGVDAAQGFWIAEPMPRAEVVPWLRRWAAAAR